MSTKHHQKRLCQAVALLSIGLSGSAIAQTGQPTVLEEVTVLGIKSSLREGLSAKRNSTQFVDSIVSDDIGKLPDINVAESLGRISGVQIDRGIGEGSDITIRGQRQNVILLNGRQIYDASGRGGTGPDRLGTSTYGLLSLVPSETIGALNVTKLASAADVEGGLGGIVDIRTRKPLDKAGFNGAASIGTGVSDVADGHDLELFGLISNTFADDSAGFLLSVSSANRNIGEEGLNTFSGYLNLGEGSGITYADPTVTGDPNGDGVFGLFHVDPRLQVIEEERDTLGVNAVFQYQPSDTVEIMVDSFYSKTESDRDRYWQGYWAGFGQHRDVQFSDNEVLVSGIVTRPIQTNVEFADVEAEIASTAASLSWDATEALSSNTMLATSTAKSSYRQLFFRLQSSSAVDIAYDLGAGPFGSFVADTNLGDANNMNLAIMFDSIFENQTDTTEFASDWKWQTDGVFAGIDFGIRVQDVQTTSDELSKDIRPNLNVASTPSVSGATELISNRFFTGLSASESGYTSCAVFLADLSESDQAKCNETSNNRSLLNTYDIEETFNAYYAKANFETDTVQGNVGLRVVSRDLTSKGNLQNADGNLSPNVFKRSDTEVLPSAVVKVDINDNLVTRFGAAKVLAFPNTIDLNNGLTLNGDLSGRGGSPDLDPFIATQLDASIEYYFAEDALASLGLFQKDIDTFIVARTDRQEIGNDTYTISRNVNGEGADVQGFEALFQMPIGDNFGVQATYSFIDSETPIEDDNGRKLTLPGLSENNLNFVVYYETDTLSTRLAYNWRDEYLQGLGPNNTGVFVDGYSDLAATFSWDATDNITVTAEALNLLDSELRTYNATKEALRTNSQYGSAYKLTVSAKF